MKLQKVGRLFIVTVFTHEIISNSSFVMKIDYPKSYFFVCIFGVFFQNEEIPRKLLIFPLGIAKC